MKIGKSTRYVNRTVKKKLYLQSKTNIFTSQLKGLINGGGVGLKQLKIRREKHEKTKQIRNLPIGVNSRKFWMGGRLNLLLDIQRGGGQFFFSITISSQCREQPQSAVCKLVLKQLHRMQFTFTAVLIDSTLYWVIVFRT
jgi:hypothetical protein